MLRERPHLVALRSFRDFQRKSVVVSWNGSLSKMATHLHDPDLSFVAAMVQWPFKECGSRPDKYSRPTRMHTPAPKRLRRLQSAGGLRVIAHRTSWIQCVTSSILRHLRCLSARNPASLFLMSFPMYAPDTLAPPSNSGEHIMTMNVLVYATSSPTDGLGLSASSGANPVSTMW